MALIKELEIGLKLNKLTILQLVSPDSHFRIRYKCSCECGNSTIVTGTELRCGRVKSCGCLRGGSTILPYSEASFNQTFLAYKRNATRRSLCFDLNKEAFKILTQDNCYYCNKEPSNNYKGEHLNGNYVYNGIDRLNSANGYTPDNCVACCKTCNLAKGTLSVDEFKEWIDNVYKHFIQKHLVE